MANTTFEDVLPSFESTFQDKTIISTTLLNQWLWDSASEFSLELDAVSYDRTNKVFSTELLPWQITTLGLMMKVKYCVRELSRINKLNNIIGKDISFNSTGDSKRYSKAELEQEMLRVQNLIDKQKPTVYVLKG